MSVYQNTGSGLTPTVCNNPYFECNGDIRISKSDGHLLTYRCHECNSLWTAKHDGEWIQVTYAYESALEGGIAPCGTYGTCGKCSICQVATLNAVVEPLPTLFSFERVEQGIAELQVVISERNHENADLQAKNEELRIELQELQRERDAWQRERNTALDEVVQLRVQGIERLTGEKDALLKVLYMLHSSEDVDALRQNEDLIDENLRLQTMWNGLVKYVNGLQS